MNSTEAIKLLKIVQMRIIKTLSHEEKTAFFVAEQAIDKESAEKPMVAVDESFFCRWCGFQIVSNCNYCHTCGRKVIFDGHGMEI